VVSKLVVSLVFKFWGHGKTFESDHFLRQRKKRMMTTTSRNNQTTKVKRPREGGVCVIFFFFGFCFVVSSFFPLYVSIKPKKKAITKKSSYYLQIKHNKRFIPQSE